MTRASLFSYKEEKQKTKKKEGSKGLAANNTPLYTSKLSFLIPVTRTAELVSILYFYSPDNGGRRESKKGERAREELGGKGDGVAITLSMYSTWYLMS